MSRVARIAPALLDLLAIFLARVGNILRHDAVPAALAIRLLHEVEAGGESLSLVIAPISRQLLAMFLSPNRVHHQAGFVLGF
eukprot:CAMPEP_0172525308 /NCGR_PEP_ID=MMETSP1067-20121228/343_1 /TAXON_ID=265564 ORGANISM="Thalassiosira punctigera, Strain Tpunct2005C2" /NCGR_SAMPLE_ID=MMETSP1067 /ASSEMBLY_ACC=CAM_ASM_000444 /LENGTH=81 /DNA_ID=CAMNT_0013308529 /DNA_START=321 /DNA_END=563 /DNA_ORIENTATION=-